MEKWDERRTIWIFPNMQSCTESREHQLEQNLYENTIN